MICPGGSTGWAMIMKHPAVCWLDYAPPCCRTNLREIWGAWGECEVCWAVYFVISGDFMSKWTIEDHFSLFPLYVQTPWWFFFSSMKISKRSWVNICMLPTESKEKREENSDFWFLGRTVRADIFGRIYLGSKKFSQMAAFVGKSKNIESSLNLNNYCQISIQLACLT